MSPNPGGILPEQGARAPASAVVTGAGKSPTRIVSRPDMLPMSFGQERMWFIKRMGGSLGEYNILAGAYRVDGPLDLDALQASVLDLADRHEALRTNLRMNGSTPVQVVGPVGPAIAVHDLSGLDTEAAAAREEEIAHSETERPFDLEREPLLRVIVVRLPAGTHTLTIVVHHAVADGWSVEILRSELTALYEARLDGRPHGLGDLPVQYADYAVWQREWAAGSEAASQLDYWKRQLAGAPLTTRLPLDRERPPGRSQVGARRWLTITPESSRALRALARRERVTPFVLLTAAYLLLLHRYSGDEDIVVGTPVAARNRHEIEDLIGFFVNTLAIRVDLSGDPSVRELLRRTNEAVLSALSRQDLPFGKLVEEINPERNLSHHPLFQATFVLEPRSQERRLGPARLIPRDITRKLVRFDLSLCLQEAPGGLSGFFEYAIDIFDEETIQQMASHFEQLLRHLPGAGDRRISEIPLEDEAAPLVLASMADEGGTAPSMHRLPDVVAEHASAHPTAAAVRVGAAEIDYGELDRRAGECAAILHASGVTAGMPVGVYLEPSLDLVVAMLGVLRVGAIVVPIDVTEPTARTTHMLDDARIAGMVTTEATAARLAAEWRRIYIDRPPAVRASTGSPAAGGNSATACWFYRSSASGRPERVAVSQDALVPSPQIGDMALAKSDRVGVAFHFGDDVSPFEMCRALTAGACLVDVSSAVGLAPRAFGRFLQQQGISVLFAQSAVVERLAREFPQALRGVCRVFCIDGRLDRVRRRTGIQASILERLFDAHGWVETGGTRVVIKASDVDDTPVIRAAVDACVLDRHFKPVPVGPIGELCIAISARDGWPDSGRAYRTGYPARRRGDGTIHILPRRDTRCTRRGVRVHVEEVEAVLRSHADVSDVAVVPRRSIDSLLAYVVCKPELTAGGPDALQSFLRSRLPEPMVTDIAVATALPRRPDGDVDRARLAARADALGDGPQGPAEYVAPRTEVEARFGQIWSEVLGIDRIGVHDNFFALGGHSLLAIQVAARISSAVGADVPLRQLFETPTIAGLAARLSSQESRRPPLPPLVRVARTGPLPASDAQRRLWFLEKIVPGSVYNIPLAFEITGPLDVCALEHSFARLIRRHELLRTTFPAADGAPQQCIAERGSISIVQEDLSAAPDREAIASERARRHAVAPFDLERGPLFRVALLRLGPDRHRLLICMHHIIMDTWSAGIMMRELSSEYQAQLRGTVHEPAELPLQYADFSAWQSQCLDTGVFDHQLTYWTRQLAGIGVLELPVDRARPRVRSYRGATVPVMVPNAVLEQLRTIGQAEDATMFVVTMAAFHALLSRYAGTLDIAVGTPITGRRHADVENIIGFFLNTVVIRADLAGAATFREVVRRVRAATLDALAHQDVPFDRVIEALAPERTLSHHSVFQVMFVFNLSRPPLGFAGTTVRAIPQTTETAKFDLLLGLRETPTGLTGDLEYSADLFDAETAEQMAGHYTRLLASAAAQPDVLFAELPLLAPQERERIVREWNHTAAPLEAQFPVHHFFERQAAQRGDRDAVVFRDERVTYAELDVRASRLAARLRGMGVAPERYVGICLEPSVEMVVAVLAALKAGGGYVPLDPSYPAERLRYMATDAQLAVVITSDGLTSLFVGSNVPTVDATALERTASVMEEQRPVDISPLGAAYVIYTSGSTGRPKGVVMPHRALANLIAWQCREHPDPLTTLQWAALSFDVSFQEMFSTWAAGGTLVLVDRYTKHDAAALLRLMERERVERVFLPFVMLQHLAETAAGGVDSLRHVVTAGEQLKGTAEIRSWFAQMPGCLLTNHYGPSEAHVVTSHELAGAPDTWPALPPIGRPIANLEMYVLDRWMQPVPAGVLGELYIGGAGVARGYHRRPAMTGERFVPDPFSGRLGDRLYKTGDLARYRRDGTIEFAGRVDHQAKIRGYRVEPGEIEATLETIEGVGQAIVVARPDAGGNLRLLAYVLAAPDAALTVAGIRERLAAILPLHLMPAAIIPLSEWPKTPSGKIDRAALPAPDAVSPRERAYKPPATDLERELARIWEAVLRITPPGSDDNFFEIGGHSLLITRVIAQARERLGVEIPVRAFFDAPTIAGLAAIAEQLAHLETRIGTASATLVDLRPDSSAVPFFCVHPATGTAVCYRDLANAIGPGCHFYGIESMPHRSQDPPLTVEQMAALYLREIRTVQPRAPYRLGGWSMGGLVAFEMARVLRMAGEDTAPVVLFDTYPPSDSRERLDRADRLERLLSDPSWIDEFTGPAGRRPNPAVDELRATMERALAGHRVPIQYASVEQMQEIVTTFAHNTLAMLRYRPPATDVPIVLFEAAAAARRGALAAGWQDYTRAVETHDAPGTHFTMLSPPHVDAVAERLAGYFARADAGVSAAPSVR